MNVPAVRLAIVAVVAKKLEMIPVAAFKSVAKKLVDVAFVVDALVAAKVLVTVALVNTEEEAKSDVIVVVARVDVPVTPRVPPIVALPVTVEVPVVAVVIVALVITAFVVVEFPTTRLRIEAKLAARLAKKPLVEVELSTLRF